MIIESIDLAFKEGSADKVYHAAIKSVGAGHDVLFAYGRRGSTLNTGAKATGLPYDKAVAVYQKLVKEKMGKGYCPAPGVSGNVFGIGMVSSSITQSVSINIPAAKAPTGYRPQLLNPISEDEATIYINNSAWGAQEKMNGTRLIVENAGGKVSGTNKKGFAVTPAAEIAAAVALLPEGVYDGEAVGNTLYLFDILFLQGVDLRPYPYIERYIHLTRVVAPSANIKVVTLAETTDDKQQMFATVKSSKGEGLVFKTLTAPYTSDRPASGGTQLKMKFYQQATCICAGQNIGRRSIKLVLSDDSGKMVNVGNCTIPANHSVPADGATVEIRYLYAYPNGSLYQPTYDGVRTDQDVYDCHTRQLVYIPEDADMDEAA